MKTKHREKDKRTFRIFLVAFVITLALGIGLYLWIAPQFLEIDMSMKVGDNLGFDVSTTEVTFGTIPLYGISHRDVIISNMNGYDKTAQFTVEGNIGEFMETPKDMIIKANGNTTVPVEVRIPGGTEYGDYTGKLKVFLRRAI